MVQPYCVSNREQVVDTMIGLTRLTSQHRAIAVAGSGTTELSPCAAAARLPAGSHRRNLPNSKGQHAVGLIAGHNSLQAIEAALASNYRHSSAASAAVAVLIESGKSGPACASGKAGADGLSDRSRRQMSGRVSCFPLSGTAIGQMKKAA